MGRAVQLLVIAALAVTFGTGVAAASGGGKGQQLPANNALPQISGSAVVGAELTGTAGSWSGVSISYGFQWVRCNVSGGECSVVSGASGATYVVSAADVGSTLRVVITTTNKNGYAVATSAPTAPASASTSSTTTTATPTTTTPTAPTAPPRDVAVDRWFSPDSPFNTRVPSDQPVDPNSTAYVAGIVESVNAKGWVISPHRWTVPVYYADVNTPRRDVWLGAPWETFANSIRNVPWPANARPDPGGDAHMAIIDRSTGCYFELYKLFQRTDGEWQGRWANRGYITNTGVYPGGTSTRGGGFVNIAGVVRPEELARGRIDHALTFAYPYTALTDPVPPATQAAKGGYTPPVGTRALPYGARIQLDPSLNLDAFGLTSWQKTIARAMQEYGAYVADTGGAFSMWGVNAQSYATDPYPAIFGNTNVYQYLPKNLAQHLRVPKLPAPVTPKLTLEDNACATMN